MTEEITKSVFVTERGSWTEYLPGETVGELLLRQGIYIDQPCGGAGLCGKCRVILSGTIPEPTSKEKKIFSEEELSQGFRLACRTKASGGMEVTIPAQDSQSIKVLDTFENGTHRAVPCRDDDGSGIAVDI